MHRDAAVDLQAGEIVGHGVLRIADVGDPVVGVDVLDAQEIEGIESEPYVLEDFAEAVLNVPVFVFDEAVTHAHVHALVCRGAGRSRRHVLSFYPPARRRP